MVVTRARAQASGLAARLRDLGAEVVELPAIRIEPRIDSEPVRKAVNDIHSYALVCLTSPNGVRLLFEALAEAGLDARALANATVAAIGPGTAAALAANGVRADVVPEQLGRRGPGRGARECPSTSAPVLVARAAEARDVLPDALRERGAEARRRRSLRDGREAPDPEAVEAAQAADYVTFTSSSTVRNLVEALGGELPRGRAHRLDRPGDERDRPRGWASRSTSRRSVTTSRASSRRCSRTQPR